MCYPWQESHQCSQTICAKRTCSSSTSQAWIWWTSWRRICGLAWMSLPVMALFLWTCSLMMIPSSCPLFKVLPSHGRNSRRRWLSAAFGHVEIRTQTRGEPMLSGFRVRLTDPSTAWSGPNYLSSMALISRSFIQKGLPLSMTPSCTASLSQLQKGIWQWGRQPWMNGLSSSHGWKKTMMKQWRSTTKSSTLQASHTRLMARSGRRPALKVRRQKGPPSLKTALWSLWRLWRKQKDLCPLFAVFCPLSTLCSPAKVQCISMLRRLGWCLPRGRCAKSLVSITADKLRLQKQKSESAVCLNGRWSRQRMRPFLPTPRHGTLPSSRVWRASRSLWLSWLTTMYNGLPWPWHGAWKLGGQKQRGMLFWAQEVAPKGPCRCRQLRKFASLVCHWLAERGVQEWHAEALHEADLWRHQPRQRHFSSQACLDFGGSTPCGKGQVLFGGPCTWKPNGLICSWFTVSRFHWWDRLAVDQPLTSNFEQNMSGLLACLLCNFWVISWMFVFFAQPQTTIAATWPLRFFFSLKLVSCTVNCFPVHSVLPWHPFALNSWMSWLKLNCALVKRMGWHSPRKPHRRNNHRRKWKFHQRRPHQRRYLHRFWIQVPTTVPWRKGGQTSCHEPHGEACRHLQADALLQIQTSWRPTIACGKTMKHFRLKPRRVAKRYLWTSPSTMTSWSKRSRGKVEAARTSLELQLRHTAPKWVWRRISEALHTDSAGGFYSDI